MNYCLYSISQVHLPYIWYMSLNTLAWPNSWWSHQMETFSALLAICAGNLPVTGEFPAQTPVTRSFDAFFYLRLNKGWVNNREAGDLRRHCAHYDVIVMFCREFECSNTKFDTGAVILLRQQMPLHIVFELKYTLWRKDNMMHLGIGSRCPHTEAYDCNVGYDGWVYCNHPEYIYKINHNEYTNEPSCMIFCAQFKVGLYVVNGKIRGNVRSSLLNIFPSVILNISPKHKCHAANLPFSDAE